ncbi:MAG: sigma-54-dependent transcriptional regulator, partial [Desulfomonilia bacterium]
STIIVMYKRIFQNQDYNVYTAKNASDALLVMKEVRIDAALVDYMMPGIDGLSLIKIMGEEYPYTMAIMVTAHGGIQEAIQAIKLGAVDFMEKPFSVEGIRSRVAHLFQIWKLRDENRRLKEKVSHTFGYEQLIGNSTLMLKLKEKIAVVGPTDASIIIDGETGTGKDLVARAIHHHSQRATNVFMPVDCGAIAESVIENELFGHERGAFTGAHTSTLGLIRSADNGTLFLDEVGELSQTMQVKLLRTIQEREVRPIGGNKSFPVDVRIIAATNKNLSEEVAKGKFREDLFYRLNVVHIHVPPLREHKEDIPLLVRYFIKSFGTDFSTIKDISRDAVSLLENYNWPGNVRELANAIRRATALGTGERIIPGDLPSHLCPAHEAARMYTPPPDGTLESYEKVAIINALELSGGNRKKASEILKIGEATLYRKIAKYRIESVMPGGSDT